ncbi:hypothetical protein KP509_32G062700 [Ceratopteris richardii]|uniref:Uncharacterized protein n=1 Tax=Ceratopteris richardii TaxID=49495 RepID=A0A8T2QVE3_CERRI|nr:hypothetical protein KP509_32G062700 [Ceratopteris richardii]
MLAGAAALTSKMGFRGIVVLIFASFIARSLSELPDGASRHSGKSGERVIPSGRRLLQTDMDFGGCPGIACPRFACSRFMYGTCDQNPTGQMIPCACCGIKCLTDVSGCSIHTQTATIPCGF